jgi:hypothetical protein
VIKAPHWNDGDPVFIIDDALKESPLLSRGLEQTQDNSGLKWAGKKRVTGATMRIARQKNETRPAKETTNRDWQSRIVCNRDFLAIAAEYHPTPHGI